MSTKAVKRKRSTSVGGVQRGHQIGDRLHVPKASRNTTGSSVSRVEQWGTTKATVTVHKEVDGQVSVFIYVPKYLQSVLAACSATAASSSTTAASSTTTAASVATDNKNEPPSASLHVLVKQFFAEQKWPSKRMPAAFGHTMPRDILWYDAQNRSYKFSSRTFQPATPWASQPKLQQLADALNKDLNERLKPLLAEHKSLKPVDLCSVLCNRYVGGGDSVSKHADNEPCLGINPTIVSVTTGISRTFVVSRKTKSEFERDAKYAHVATPTEIKKESYSYPLGDGDLFILLGAANEYWSHGIAKDLPRDGASLSGAAENKVRENMTWRPFVLSS